ncbi:alpha/beta hydrolase [Nonomuraea sp. NPDC047529]|uniref:alpha/beta fold hydrolase n=1 Tax=Nonomuraea sp. NPDC047529 TaxID=3155623 RepID=UPI0033D50838
MEAPDRVRSLTVLASSPLGGGEGQVLMRALTGQPQPEGSLPEPAPEFVEFFRVLMAAPPAPGRRALIDGMIAEQCVLHGTGLPFDEDAARRLQERIYDRARDLSAVANHRLAAAAGPDFEPVGVLHRVKAPTLVIEGSHEPVKPGHGAIIAEQIPGARLTIVAGMGHTLPAGDPPGAGRRDPHAHGRVRKLLCPAQPLHLCQRQSFAPHRPRRPQDDQAEEDSVRQMQEEPQQEGLREVCVRDEENDTAVREGCRPQGV